MNTYLNARVCYLHKVNKADVLLVIEIFENDNHSISVNLIEHLKDEIKKLNAQKNFYKTNQV